MAEMNTLERSSQGPRRAPKSSTRVDLTAMVDLGFLLITFFMLASAFQKPKAMEVNKPMPEDSDDPVELKVSKTLSLISGKGDKVYCYIGADDASNVPVDTIDFARSALRQRILARKQEVMEAWGSADDFVVILKFFPKSKYRNMVDLLDEMKICGVNRYVIMDELNEIDGMIAANTGNL